MRAQAVGERGVERAPGTHGSATIRSPVYWALLGLVIERSGYGYDLLKRFQREYGELLPISSESHIYTALNVLERRHLIERVSGGPAHDPGAGRQPKPHYQATDEGVDGYRRWLMAQVRSDRLQSWLFVRQLAVFAHEPDVALQIIDRYQSACLEEAANAPSTCVDDTPGGDASALATRLSSEESRLAMEARLPWVSYARRQFEALAEARMPSDEPA